MTNQMVTEDLQKLGTKYSIDLGHASSGAAAVDDVYYPQFDAAIRVEAASMSKHYEEFYCLEKTIRALVAETLEASEKNCRVVGLATCAATHKDRSC